MSHETGSWIGSMTCRRVFSEADQNSFAELSGDWNPIHVDKIAARRSIAGDLVVHGMHLVLLALEDIIADSDSPCRILKLTAKFSHPVLVGQAVTIKRRLLKNGDHGIDICTGERRKAQLTVRLGLSMVLPLPLPKIDLSQLCQEIDQDAIAEAAGKAPLGFAYARAVKMFPAVTRCLNKHQFAALLGITRIIGMTCPGERSLFAELKLLGSDQASKTLSYAVSQWYPNYAMLELNVTGGGLTGKATCFLRPPPVHQPSISEMVYLITDDRFAHMDALIIGGSRGLGEVTAKLIATGGGKGTITYQLGGEDASRVCAEIRKIGGTFNRLQLDVTALHPTLRPPRKFSHVFYFASPHIEAGVLSAFDTDLYQLYRRFYVTGFRNLVDWCWPCLAEKPVFYVPSTVFIDEMYNEFAEYCRAKEESEALCKELQETYEAAHFHAPRLPKMCTDQTQSIVPAVAADPVAVMLEQLHMLT